jgi:GNAT superfamily N-acetyltransferase
VKEIEIRRTGYLAPDAQVLIKAALADLGERYGGGEGDGTPVEPAQFEPPDGAFFVAYLVVGTGEVAGDRPVACGAWRSHDGDRTTAEIKRMYTVPAARGRGLARAVLAAVEESARENGRRAVVLETGDRQPEAIKLYESAGYRRIPNFGFYADHPGCVSLGRELAR